MPEIGEPALLERDREVVAIGQALHGAGEGRGTVIVLEGAAGSGKSALLAVAAEMAAAAELRVIGARAGELERGQPFGVIRQLFEPVLGAASASDRGRLLRGAAAPAAHVLGVGGSGEGGHAAGFAALQAIYWLTSELSLEAPVLAVVDDAHWSDGSSLRALDFLARRVADLPLVLLVAFRSDEPGARTDLLDGLRDGADVRLSPAALGHEAVASIVRVRIPDADEEICRAFALATAGNPLYVNELLRAVHINGDPLLAQDIAATPVRFLGDRVLRRIERVGPGADPLARAMAVLGDRTRLATAAALAGLAIDEAGEIAHQLRRIEVLHSEDPVRFLHPLIRESIGDTIPVAEREAAHRRAAAVLRDRGAPAEDIAAHLSRLPPSGDPEVARTLAAAAGTALERAAPEEAVPWLARALNEQAPDPAPAALLSQLGLAQAVLRDPTALGTLQEAYGCAPAGAERLRVGILLAELLAQSGQWVGARTLIEALEREADPGRDAAVTELAAIRAAVTLFDPDGVADFDRRRGEYERLARLDHWGADALSALLGAEAASRGRPREALAHAVRARSSGRLLAERGAGGWTSPQLLAAYVLADELDTADLVCTELETASRASGAVFGLMTALTYRAWLNAQRGELAGAEAVLWSALELAEDSGMLMVLTTAAFLLVDVVLERSLTRVEDVVEQTQLPPDFLATASGAMLLESRGRLRLARHDRSAAVADLRAAGEINRALRFVAPWSAWRSSLALALPPESREEARGLAAEELELARSTGLARPTGVALRTLGVLDDPAAGIDRLRESVEVLEGSSARLELARSLVELGGALRRANRRSEAREPLVAGLRLAHDCGAHRLGERADRELAAGGGRRPRLHLSGRDALTASELRVGELAAAGATNAEIAQALYVSVKTVETHLSRTYDKLGLAGPGSRGRLARALSDVNR